VAFAVFIKQDNCLAYLLLFSTKDMLFILFKFIYCLSSQLICRRQSQLVLDNAEFSCSFSGI
jgi:hypothetical protein